MMMNFREFYWLLPTHRSQIALLANKPILSDKSMSSCLLQNAQKPRQHNFAPDQGRYVAEIVSNYRIKCWEYHL